MLPLLLSVLFSQVKLASLIVKPLKIAKVGFFCRTNVQPTLLKFQWSNGTTVPPTLHRLITGGQLCRQCWLQNPHLVGEMCTVGASNPHRATTGWTVNTDNFMHLGIIFAKNTALFCVSSCHVSAHLSAALVVTCAPAVLSEACVLFLPSVCLCVCVYMQKLKNYWSQIDVTW